MISYSFVRFNCVVTMPVATAFARKGPTNPKFNTSRSCDRVMVQQWENFLAAQAIKILNEPPENIEEYWVALKSGAE